MLEARQRSQLDSKIHLCTQNDVLNAMAIVNYGHPSDTLLFSSMAQSAEEIQGIIIDNRRL